MASTGRAQIQLPGMNPRPQKLFIGEKEKTEEFNSESKSTFVFVQNCEDFTLHTKGKVGKILCELGKNIHLLVSDRIVGGTLEVIKSHGVEIILMDGAEIPIVTIDGSTDVQIIIKKKSQIQSVYFHDSKNIKLTLKPCSTEEDSNSELIDFVVDTENKESYDSSGEPLQYIAHWTSASDSAQFLTENVVRDGVYPSTAEKKNAAEQRERDAMNRLVDLLLRPRPSGRRGNQPQGGTHRSQANQETARVPESQQLSAKEGETIPGPTVPETSEVNEGTSGEAHGNSTECSPTKLPKVDDA